MNLFPELKGAEFSPCRTWRYALWRFWGDGSHIAFIGLNPSTADENKNDPTIRRCIKFAKDWGYGGMYMLNAYAFRATDPMVMKSAADPIGPDNDRALKYFAFRRCRDVVAVWGVHCEPERAVSICEMIERPMQCMGVNADGSPKHPLYLKADTFYQPFVPVRPK